MAAAGLTPTPYKSGSSHREQGISKSGNPRVQTLLIELAWCWLRYQADSKHAKWFQERFRGQGSRHTKVGIVALARRLLVDFWKYVEHGIVPEGAKLKTV
ncbi:MAG: transposase [Myxococcota bacterium]